MTTGDRRRPDRASPVDPVAGRACEPPPATGRPTTAIMAAPVLAAHRHHAGQRLDAGGWPGPNHMKPAAATPAAPVTAAPAGHEEAAPAAAGSIFGAGRYHGNRRRHSTTDARPPRLRLEPEHSAGRRLHALHYPRPTVVVVRSTPPPASRMGLSAAVGQPVDARPRKLGRARADPGPDRLRHQRLQAPSIAAAPRAQPRVRHRRRGQPRYSRDPPRPARAQQPVLAAGRLPAPRDHRRHHPGEPAARPGRGRAGLGHPQRHAGVDVPLGAAGGPALQ